MGMIKRVDKYCSTKGKELTYPLAVLALSLDLSKGNLYTQSITKTTVTHLNAYMFSKRKFVIKKVRADVCHPQSGICYSSQKKETEN
jgi:hypothetical protein